MKITFRISNLLPKIIEGEAGDIVERLTVIEEGLSNGYIEFISVEMTPEEQLKAFEFVYSQWDGD